MSNRLMEFLKEDKLDARLVDIIKDIRIDKVVVSSKSRRWDIYIKISSVIGSEAISEIENKIKDVYKAVENVRIINKGPATEEVSRDLAYNGKDVISNAKETALNGEFVAFDIETTGLSYLNDKIIEIGAVRIRDGEICDRFSSLIDPEIDIPQNIISLTGINNEMVKGKPKIDEVLPMFIEFAGDAVLVAHNAKFDLSFIKKNAKELGYNIKNPVADTLALSKSLFTNLKKHKLDIVAQHLSINLENHHRAIDDAECAGKILLKCCEILREKGVQNISDIIRLFTYKQYYK